MLPAATRDAEEARVMVVYRSEETVIDAMDLMESFDGRFIKEIEQGRILVYSLPTRAILPLFSRYSIPGPTTIMRIWRPIRNILRVWADDIGQPGYDQYNGYGLLDCWGQVD